MFVEHVFLKNYRIFLLRPYITNLKSHELVMKIMQILFIHNSYVSSIDIMHEKTFDIWIYKKMWNLCDICSFISSHFICQYIYRCVKCVFNAWYSCVKCTNLWMDKLCTISLLIHCMLNLWCNIMEWSCFSPLHYEMSLPLHYLAYFNRFSYCIT